MGIHWQGRGMVATCEGAGPGGRSDNGFGPTVGGAPPGGRRPPSPRNGHHLPSGRHSVCRSLAAVGYGPIPRISGPCGATRVPTRFRRSDRVGRFAAGGCRCGGGGGGAVGLSLGARRRSRARSSAALSRPQPPLERLSGPRVPPLPGVRHSARVAMSRAAFFSEKRAHHPPASRRGSDGDVQKLFRTAVSHGLPSL